MESFEEMVSGALNWKLPAPGGFVQYIGPDKLIQQYVWVVDHQHDETPDQVCITLVMSVEPLRLHATETIIVPTNHVLPWVPGDLPWIAKCEQKVEGNWG